MRVVIKFKVGIKEKAESPFAYTAVWGLDSLNLQNKKDYSAWQYFVKWYEYTPRERLPLSDDFIRLKAYK